MLLEETKKVTQRLQTDEPHVVCSVALFSLGHKGVPKKKKKSVFKTRPILHENTDVCISFEELETLAEVVLGSQVTAVGRCGVGLPGGLSISVFLPHSIAPQHLDRVSATTCHYMYMVHFIKENFFYILGSLGRVKSKTV